MRKTAYLTALLLFVGSLGFTRMADPFDGTKWEVTVTPDPSAPGNEKEFKDMLIFKGGMFRATECEKHGFKWADGGRVPQSWINEVNPR